MGAQKIVKLGIEKEVGYLYYVDSDGDISRVKANRKGRKKGTRNKSTRRQGFSKNGIKKNPR